MLPTATPPTGTGGSWILAVDAPGPVWLGPDWLRAHGVDASLAPDEVRLTQEEHQVPYLLLVLPEGPGIFFFATETPSRYASWTSYRLDVGQGPGQLIEAARAPTSAPSDSLAQAAADAAQGSTWTASWHEEDLQYRPQIPVDEPWFWEPIYSRTRITHTLSLAEAVSGPITLTVRLASRQPATSNGPPPTIWWDREQIGEWRWDGPETQSWLVELAHSNGARGHLLAIDLPGQPDGPVSRIWLDGYGATFRRPLAITGSDLNWTAEADEAVVAGAEGLHLLDITDPTAPLHLDTVEGERIPSVAGHRYWVGSPWLAPAPREARPVTTMDLQALEAADYLMVAPEPFWSALEPLAELRQGQGMNVFRITPWQVYDAYGDGRPDPAAIRYMVRQLHDQGRLRYLLLVGDASSRPDGHAGEYNRQLVVTDLVPTTHLHETPSDETLVVDEQDHPLVAVGRLPAQTPADVEAMVQKTLQWEASIPSPALVLHDDQSDFARFVDQVSPLLPASTRRLEVAQEGARSAVLEQLGRESTWLNYVGHGSLALWADEQVLRRDDDWRESAVVTVWACLSGYFVHPEEDSLAEIWLRSPEGGAVAFVGPTGETYLVHQEPLARVFYEGIQAGNTLGEALLAAWQNSGDSELDVVRSYLLLGDPALRLNAVEPE